MLYVNFMKNSFFYNLVLNSEPVITKKNIFSVDKPTTEFSPATASCPCPVSTTGQRQPADLNKSAITAESHTPAGSNKSTPLGTTALSGSWAANHSSLCKCRPTACSQGAMVSQCPTEQCSATETIYTVRR